MTSSSDLCRKALLESHNPAKKFVRHEGSDKLALIIEPRFDAICEAVIHNFMTFLNPLGWNLCILSYSGHREKIQAKYESAYVFDIGAKHITLNSEGEPNINITSYNAIMMDIELWRRLPARKIVVFQRDCIMFNDFSSHYLEYHFAGANYYGDAAPIYGGINGGFSIRDRNVMVECLEKITWDNIYEYRNARKYSMFPLSPALKQNEDVFFTHACEILCKIVPDVLSRTFLAVEMDFNPATSVYHGWDKNFLSAEKVRQLLDSSSYFTPAR
jgi:hypothetical protein